VVLKIFGRVSFLREKTVIGVNRYETNGSGSGDRKDQLVFRNLKYCVNDTNVLAVTLEKGRFAPKENAFVMNDTAKEPAMRPTKENILACLNNRIL